MLERPRRGVFISYARADGEEFATRLRKDLERDAPDVGVIWQDRANLEAGFGWWPQITDAIDHSEFMLLVVTPKAVESEIVRKEWRYARQLGVCVYPVVAARDINLQALPRWMGNAHFHHLPKEWPTLLGYLRSPCRTHRIPFMTPDLPAHYVHRPVEFEQLRAYLLDPARENPVAITTALRGAGGFGKTTLAMALCHDEEVQTAFDDGILWVTLGERPDVLAGLTQLYAAVTGQRPAFSSQEDAAYHLSERLRYKNCLIVIDDVWNRAHLQPFLRGGKQSARLITTRLNDVVPEARQVLVDAMEEQQAIDMLGFESDPAGVARRLGRWPLLLELARSMLQQMQQAGESLEASLAYLREALNEEGVEAFDHQNPIDRNQAIRVSMEVSLSLLTPEQRGRYQQLAIFPDDVDIAVSAVRTLWGLGEFQSKKLLRFLRDLSLLKFDRTAAAIRLHDVIRSWLAGQLANPKALHVRLVDAWTNRYPLPDTYAWRWLAYHLVCADRRAELRQLLLGVAWMQAKLAATDITALLSDYDYLRPDPELELVQSALRLSAHVISQDISQVPGQLLGRIPAGVSILNLEQTTNRVWLRPINASLLRAGGALLQNLIGHHAPVNAVAATEERHRAVSASRDHTLKVWDLETGRDIATLAGHRNAIHTVAITAGGRRAVSGSADHTLKVWDLETGRDITTLAGHRDAIHTVAITGDGRRAVSGSADHTLKVWDLETGRDIATLVGHRDAIRTVAITGDGCRAVSGSADHTLKVWDLETGRDIATLAGHRDAIHTVAITRDGCRAVSGSADHTLKIWDLETGRDIATLAGHRDAIHTAAITGDGRRAVSGSADHTLKVWDLETGRDIATLAGHKDAIHTVAITGDGRRVISGSADYTVKVWHIDAACELSTLIGHSSKVAEVVVTTDGRRAISAAHDHTLKVWDIEAGSQRTPLSRHTGLIYAVAVSGLIAISVSKDRTFKLWDLETGFEIETLAIRLDDVLAVTGWCAVSASNDHTLKVWGLKTGDEIATLAGHTDAVTAMAISLDGRRAVSASSDHAFKLWDLQNRCAIVSLSGHTDLVNAVAISPDGWCLVSASRDHTLKLWDLLDGRAIATLTGHSDAVTAVVISHDNRRAISASVDRTVRVWDLHTRREITALAGHTDVVTGVAVTADGTRAVSVSLDSTLKVWDLEAAREIATFTTDGPLHCCAFALDGRLIVTGGAHGRLHFLQLIEPWL